MRYATVVVDPPWSQGTTGRDFGLGDWRSASFEPHAESRPTTVPYQVQTLEWITALPVDDLAAVDAHLYLWTTQKFLEAAFGIVREWGFKYPTTLVWCKEPPGLHLGGAYRSSTEFILFARRGNLAHQATEDRQWFRWPRTFAAPVARGQERNTMHSAKPEAFVDMVERVSPGPYVELFARRARFGWDYWGDESLGTAELHTATEEP